MKIFVPTVGNNYEMGEIALIVPVVLVNARR